MFGVGYAVGGPREFSSHYDLLASECRLASLVAIAKGDVPAEHWFALSRPYSYSSHEPDAAVLERNDVRIPDAAAVHPHLQPTRCSITPAGTRSSARSSYGDENGIPWGISESACSALDAHQIYQYRAFGVPALALNPATEDGSVVSPYSTVLATAGGSRQPPPANLERLKNLGLTGPMGFYESIDFTRESAQERRPRRGDLLLHGSPPGDEPGGAGQRAAPRRDAAALPRRSAHSRRRDACCSKAFRSRASHRRSRDPASADARRDAPRTSRIAYGPRKPRRRACICTATGATR